MCPLDYKVLRNTNLFAKYEDVAESITETSYQENSSMCPLLSRQIFKIEFWKVIKASSCHEVRKKTQKNSVGSTCVGNNTTQNEKSLVLHTICLPTLSFK